MAAKSTGYCGKILAALFTSVLAPLLVHLVEQDQPFELIGSNLVKPAPSPGEGADRSSAPSRSLPDARSPSAAAMPPGAKVVHVIARGVGRTPEASLQDALRTGLCQAGSALNEAKRDAQID